jgi:hypothetical protein
MARHRCARMCSGSPKRALQVMGFQVTEVQKSLEDFDYRGFPEGVAGHAESNGRGSDLVGALRSLQKESFDGPTAVMHSLSEDGVLTQVHQRLN